MLNNIALRTLRIRIPPLVRTGGATQPESPPAATAPEQETPAPEEETPAYESNSPAYSPTSPPYDPPLMDLEPLDRRARNGTPVYSLTSPAYDPTLNDLQQFHPLRGLEPLDINMDPERDPFRDLEQIMNIDPIQLVLDSVQDSEVRYVRTVRASQMQGSVTMRATRNQWEEIMSAAEGA